MQDGDATTKFEKNKQKKKQLRKQQIYKTIFCKQSWTIWNIMLKTKQNKNIKAADF